MLSVFAAQNMLYFAWDARSFSAFPILTDA